MRRWLHRTPFLLSLLWCGVVLALWARSYVVRDTVGRLWMTTGYGWWAEHSADVTSSGGVVQWKRNTDVFFDDSEESRQRREWTQRGFYYEHVPFEPLITGALETGKTVNAYSYGSVLPLSDGSFVSIGVMRGAAVPHWVLLLPGLGAAAATHGPARRASGPRRWRRALFRVVVAMPLVLLAATLALWLGSRRVGWHFDRLERTSDGVVVESRNTTVIVGRGILLVGKARARHPVDVVSAGRRVAAPRVTNFYSVPRPPAPLVTYTTPVAPKYGFGYATGPTNVGASPGTATVVTVPLWAFPAATLPFVILSAWSISRARRTARRLRLGECVRCGYDLRESRERCPECGLVFAPGIAGA